MYERLLKQTERYLENRKEVAVPVKQLWDAIVKEGTKNDFTVPALLADFECLLEGDSRFEFVAERKPPAGKNPDFAELLEHDELEKLGFLSSHKVKLRRVSLPSLEEEESLDALDAAISIEDLGDDFPDSVLLDEDGMPTVRERSDAIPPVVKKGGSASEPGRPLKSKSVKPRKKVAKKNPSAKKRKK